MTYLPFLDGDQGHPCPGCPWESAPCVLCVLLSPVSTAGVLAPTVALPVLETKQRPLSSGGTCLSGGLRIAASWPLPGPRPQSKAPRVQTVSSGTWGLTMLSAPARKLSSPSPSVRVGPLYIRNSTATAVFPSQFCALHAVAFKCQIAIRSLPF